MTEEELLFTEILNCDRAQLFLNRDKKLEKSQQLRIAQALRRRACGEPVQYILGKSWFMGLQLRVDNRVLIPRPETELVVETCLEHARNKWAASGFKGKALSVCDIGTGSGVIAISLAVLLDQPIKIYAVDISAEALKVAAENARAYAVSDRIEFVEADLFPADTGQLDIIVSNPPYVRSGEISRLGREIGHEPRGALDGGSDGLDFYRRFAREAGARLKDKGVIILETGYDQAPQVRKIFDEERGWRFIGTVRDYGGIERVTVAEKSV